MSAAGRSNFTLGIARRGFTLVEIMVALTTGLLVAGVIATMFASNARTYAFTSSVGDLQAAGRVAFEVLQHDIRAAGYTGCDSSGRAAAPVLAHLDEAALTPPLTASVAANGDMLVLQVPVGEAFTLAQPMRDPAAPLATRELRGIAPGQQLLIADCSAAALFRVTGNNAGVLGHDRRRNRSDALPHAFGADALLLRMETHRYFIAPASNPADGERALWRQVNQHAPAEIAAQVQELRLQFGIDTDGDGIPNRFVRTAELTPADWPHVTAVQLSLLLRGANATRRAAAASYVFNGLTVTPTDGRLYRVYSATLPLRNRQS
jgi:type IV pilus assembly protein PilW